MIKEGYTKDSNNGFKYLKEVYDQTDSSCSRFWSVPVSHDKRNRMIVSNGLIQIIDCYGS